MGTVDVTQDTDLPTMVPCPACGAPFAWPPTAPCSGCGAQLRGPTATAIFDTDREADALRRRRAALVDQLRAAAPRPAIDLPPPALPPVGPSGSGPIPSRIRPQFLLAAAGAVLLLAAVVVFIAVTWPTWPPGAQVAFVMALTALGAMTARATAQRGLPATADAIGVLTLAVAGYSLLAARAEGLAGLDAIDVRLWLALVATAIAVVARPFTGWAGLRSAPRRAAVLAAVVAAASALLWLTAAGLTTPAGLAPLAAAPAAAALLVLHGRWVLRPDDVIRHVVPVAPALLLGGAAVATGVVAFTPGSAAAVGLAASVGLPLLVLARQRAQEAPWTFVGAVIAALWCVQIVTFVATDAVAGALDLVAPRLVTFSAAAAIGTAVARRWHPPTAWRDPALVAGALAVVPSAGATLAAWFEQLVVVATALVRPFAGWPASDSLTATDLLLTAVALTIGAGLVERARRDLAVPFLVVGGSLAVLLTAVAAAASGLLPVAAPLLVAGAAAGVAAWRWELHPAAWAPVAMTDVTAIIVSGVDLELFAVVTAAIAVHLVWVAIRRSHPITAASGAATGLVAVAAASESFGWSTSTTTLLVTLAAGGVMVGAQLIDALDPWRHTATDAVVAIAAVSATVVAQVAAPATTVATQLAVIAVVAVVHAARPARGWAVWLASTATSLAIWTLLGDRGVDVIEAYTLPAAATLTAAGAWRLRATDTSSWAALWPGLAMASLPTLEVIVDGPDTPRVLALATGAVLVALVGHWRRLAAPLAVGTVVAMITAVLQLHDWTQHLPRWVTFGVLGIALIGASATYETQLQRARAVGQHLRALR